MKTFVTLIFALASVMLAAPATAISFTEGAGLPADFGDRYHPADLGTVSENFMVQFWMYLSDPTDAFTMNLDGLFDLKLYVSGNDYTYTVYQQITSLGSGYTQLSYGQTGFDLSPPTQQASGDYIFAVEYLTLDPRRLLNPLYGPGIALFMVEGTKVGDLPAVPLPMTAPLLAGALGGLGWLARRRKRRA